VLKAAPAIVKAKPSLKAFFLVILPSSLVKKAFRFFLIFGILSMERIICSF